MVQTSLQNNPLNIEPSPEGVGRPLAGGEVKLGCL